MVWVSSPVYFYNRNGTYYFSRAHRAGLAANAGIVTDGYCGLHWFLLNAKHIETDGRPQGACKLLITLG